MAAKKKEDPLGPLKEAIARELGLWEKVRERGWGGLSAAETGRLGGLLYHRTRPGALLYHHAHPGGSACRRTGFGVRSAGGTASEQEQDGEVGHEEDQPQRHSRAGPVPAADAELAGRNDVGDVPGDEHTP